MHLVVFVVVVPCFSDSLLWSFLFFVVEAFTSSSRDIVIKMTNKREDREKEQAITGLKSNKNELSAEYTESHKLMIHWLNHTSRYHTTIPIKLPQKYDTHTYLSFKNSTGMPSYLFMVRLNFLAFIDPFIPCQAYSP